MEGIVRAITVANTPTTKMETLMTQIISISEACKNNVHYTVIRVVSITIMYIRPYTVIRVVSITIEDYWDMTPCILVNRL